MATILDPHLKLRYFEQSWLKEWMNGINEKLEEHIETFVKAMGLNMNNDWPNKHDAEMHGNQESNTAFGSWRCLDDAEDDDTEMGWRIELEAYLKASRVKDYRGFSVRDFWISNQGRFPILSRVALELLSIPSISTEVERIFSGYIDCILLLITERN